MIAKTLINNWIAVGGLIVGIWGTVSSYGIVPYLRGDAEYARRRRQSSKLIYRIVSPALIMVSVADFLAHLWLQSLR